MDLDVRLGFMCGACVCVKARLTKCVPHCPPPTHPCPCPCPCPALPQPSSSGEVAYTLRSCPHERPVFVPQCAFGLRMPEDLQLGHCLFSLGVRIWDTRDNVGREFFSFTDPKTWSQGFDTVLTVPWYYQGRYMDNFGTVAKHLADHVVSLHLGYDPSLSRCWLQVYDAICALEPGADYGRKTLTTAGAVGEWFDNRRYELLGTDKCPVVPESAG
jgi:hypothetical protein